MKKKRRNLELEKPPKMTGVSFTIKLAIYKYTGLYLFHKEENNYIDSDAHWKEFARIVEHQKNNIGIRDVDRLLVSLWQAHNGIVRPLVLLRYRRPRWFFRPIGWFVTLYTVLKRDLRNLCGKGLKAKEKENG